MTTQPPMICISLRYADAPKMHDWLIEAFGFEKLAAHIPRMAGPCCMANCAWATA